MKKKFSLILITVFTVTFALPTFAQDLPKEEKKVWKDKLKAFYNQYKKNVAGFKNFIEEKDAAEKQIPTLEAEVDRLNGDIRNQTPQIDNLRSENSTLAQEIRTLEAESGNGPPPNPGGIPSTGLAFTVQIGAYTKITGLNGGTSGQFHAVPDGSVTKYMIGVFTNYNEAQMMRDALRSMGAKDAFVVAYQDGNRVPITDDLKN